MEVLDLFPGHVVRQHLTVDVGLAHSSGDQLRVLCAKIERDHRVDRFVQS